MDKSNLLRIGIFYDGNYFYHVSNYYCYFHERRSRLSISGIHDFIRRLTAKFEGTEPKLCQIVDCHYFRGRLPAQEANVRKILLNERMFDDILMREGVVTHYLPVTRGGEKGVDVSLALEAMELTIFKKFDVVVLIASDGDYVPLVRKLNSLGTRVMVLGWDFEYTDDNGNPRYTATSRKLMNEVTYPVWMYKVVNGEDPSIKLQPSELDMLFVPGGYAPESSSQPVQAQEQDNDEDSSQGQVDYDLVQPETAAGNNYSGIDNGQYEPMTAHDMGGVQQVGDGIRRTSRILQLKNGYGFLDNEGAEKNLFFFWEDLEGIDFNSLSVGDVLEYEIGTNDRGGCARHITRAKA